MAFDLRGVLLGDRAGRRIMSLVDMVDHRTVAGSCWAIGTVKALLLGDKKSRLFNLNSSTPFTYGGKEKNGRRSGS